MQTIRSLLNRIRWDSRLSVEEYELVIMDRNVGEVRVPLAHATVDEGMIIVGGKEIPLHRIRKVYRKGRLVWERNVPYVAPAMVINSHFISLFYGKEYGRGISEGG